MMKVDVCANLGGFKLDIAFQSTNGITALFGPSGAGKTSLLRLLAGLEKPEKGYVEIGGRLLFSCVDNVNLSPRERRVGYVSQAADLFPHLSVRRNLTYSQWAGNRQQSLGLDEVGALMGITQLLDRGPTALSGGERQRIAIGRALLSDPSLLLLDEPLSALDPNRKFEVIELIKKVHQATKLPIIFISHSVDDVVRLADNLVVLQEGKVLDSGTVEVVLGKITDRKIKGGEHAGCLLSGECNGYQNGAGLIKLNIDGQQAFLPGSEVAVGERVRLWIDAKDVALALNRPEEISIQNMFDCQVSSLREVGAYHVEVGLSIGSQQLLSRITQKAVQDLGLKKGQHCVALVKAVALAGEGLINYSTK